MTIIQNPANRQPCPGSITKAPVAVDTTPRLLRLLRRGGLRLKIIGFLALIVLATVAILNYFFISLMEETVSQKIYEVVETSLVRIGEVSRLALLERTLENRINLDEILQSTRSSDIEGLLDVSIFATVKKEDSLELVYFTGFQPASEKSFPPDDLLTSRGLQASDEAIFRDAYLYNTGSRVVPAYRYVKPIFTEYQGINHLLGTVVLVYSKEAVHGSVQSVIKISIMTTLIILAVSIAVTYLLGSRFTRPILTVAEAASRMAAGNLNTRVDIHTGDEIEDLGKSFNLLIQELRRKEMMQKFVSSSTIDMIERGEFRQLGLGGQHRTVTLLFSDIRNFTAVCEGKPPHEVVAIANFYLNLQACIIKKLGGDIDKFVGDEIMALFNGDNSIEQAVDAALEIQRAIKQENIRRRQRNLTTVEVGIGINHGEVVVGNIGAYDRMDFTAMGSVVNQAAKLCARAHPSQVLVEKKTYLSTGRPMRYRKLEIDSVESREDGACNAQALTV